MHRRGRAPKDVTIGMEPGDRTFTPERGGGQDPVVLTPREVEVLRWVITGALNKQIASHLGITEKTVKIHRGQVTKKLGLTTVAELVHACRRAGIEPEIPPKG